AGDGCAYCPEDGCRDVVECSATAAKDPHRGGLRVPIHAGDAAAVVGVGGDQTADESAMPGARLARRPVAALVVTRIVTGIRRIVVTPAAIVGHPGIADEVVAGQDATRELRMLRDASI